MTLNVIGLGLDFEDLTYNGFSVISASQRVMLLETHYYSFDKEKLEKNISKTVTTISVEHLQEDISSLLKELRHSQENVALLMPGNPFCEDLYYTIATLCHQLNIDLKVIHNSSYLNAMGNTGIQLYKFAHTIFVNDIPNTLDKCSSIIRLNMKRNLNTLLIYNKKSNISLKFTEDLSNLMFTEAGPKPSAYIVTLFTQDNVQNFEYFRVGDKPSSNNIEAAAVCVDVDCIEKEYLELMEYSARQRRKSEEKSSKKGNFNMIGLGLGKPEDITLKGKRLIERSAKVFLEGYTSIMLGGKEDLEAFFKKEIIVVDRETVEQRSDEILGHLERGINVSFLVVGDPFGATTHTDIILRSLDKANDVLIANNASIINAIGLSGLKPSKFGGIVSIPFWTDSYRPDSFYDKIAANKKNGLHTLCLLDIQVKEQSIENLMRGKKVYEKPRYMSVSVAAQQLLECKHRNEGNCEKLIDENDQAICLLRIGTEDELITLRLLGDLPSLDLGPPLHSLIIVGNLEEDEKLLNLKR